MVDRLPVPLAVVFLTRTVAEVWRPQNFAIARQSFLRDNVKCEWQCRFTRQD
jgi:hypothetical protein